MSKPLDLEEIRAALGDVAPRVNVEILRECDSTNARLMAMPQAVSGTVLCTERQTAGRGRRGRSWLHSEESLAFSLLWRMPGNPAGLSLAAGLALARVLAPSVQLKWPNDVLRDGHKLAGILIESPAPGRYVIGIGINVGDISNLPSDLHAAALPASDRSVCLGRVLAALVDVLDSFAQQGFAALREEWQHYDAFAGRAVRVIGVEEQQGICRGVDSDGALLLETSVGMMRILSGDVSLRAA